MSHQTRTCLWRFGAWGGAEYILLFVPSADGLVIHRQPAMRTGIRAGASAIRPCTLSYCPHTDLVSLALRLVEITNDI